MLDHIVRDETILVVEDEEAIQDLIATALKFRGFEVVAVATGQDAIAAVSATSSQLIVLDVNLPDFDGFEVCRQLRSKGCQIPVVFLTARDSPADVRSGFTQGGDDYITKPFSLEELLLRIDAVLRRTRRDSPSGRLSCGEISLDQTAYQVWRGSDEVSLSPTEFRLLRYLLLNQGRVLSKDQILEQVWGYGFEGEQAVVETYISYLRRKLGDRDARLIQTVRGFGYTLRPPKDPTNRS